MAYYGIPSAAQALTASIGNDTVEVANLGGTLLTAQSIYGADGNDVISLGAVGTIVTGSATMSGPWSVVTSSLVTLSQPLLLPQLVQPPSSSSSQLRNSSLAFSLQLLPLLSRQSEPSTLHICKETLVTTPSPSVRCYGISANFAGGAGNDVIGSYKNFNDTWAATE